jgi:hypothetical protein
MLLGGSVGSSSLYAQALPTATKGAEITVFGGYTASKTDYGDFAKTGFMGGANFTLFPSHWFVEPSVEFRFDYARSNEVSEHAYLVGPRLQKDIKGGRLHPYADFLFGQGTINFNPAVLGVERAWGPARSYGGGVDFDISRHLSLKGDFQEQSWNTGKNPKLKPDGSDFTLSPQTFIFGVTYHFQFKGLNKQQELR